MALIKLTKGLLTIVDDNRFDELNSFKWHACGPRGLERPARKLREPSKRLIYIYHQVLNIMPWTLNGLHVDHVNRNPLDNRLENLRIVTASENHFNSDRSEFAKGVCYDRTFDKFKSYIGSGKTRINVGTFATEKEAIEARRLYMENNQ